MEEFEFVLLLLESESLSDCDESFELPLESAIPRIAKKAIIHFDLKIFIIGLSKH